MFLASVSMLGDSFVLRNRQLHVPAKRWLNIGKER